MSNDLGPIYTKGKSYRARAEARQREYRASLGVAHGSYGHLLAQDAANEGRNFVVAEAFEAAQARQRAGKGVAPRTFENMLSSQAMAFNLFAPLTTRLDLAGEVLRPFVPGLATVTSIEIEHTPPADIFNDQIWRGGVDCDIFIEGTNASGEPLVVVIETKFVEPEFSICGFRKSGRREGAGRLSRGCAGAPTGARASTLEPGGDTPDRSGRPSRAPRDDRAAGPCGLGARSICPVPGHLTAGCPRAS